MDRERIALSASSLSLIALMTTLPVILANNCPNFANERSACTQDTCGRYVYKGKFTVQGTKQYRLAAAPNGVNLGPNATPGDCCQQCRSNGDCAYWNLLLPSGLCLLFTEGACSGDAHVYVPGLPNSYVGGRCNSEVKLARTAASAVKWAVGPALYHSKIGAAPAGPVAHEKLSDRAFCLISDPSFHINMQLSGYMDNRGATASTPSAFGGNSRTQRPAVVRAWIREVSLMWGRGGPGQAQHVLRMAARRTAQQERGDGYVATIEVDGHPMPKLVLGDELSLFDGAATILLAAYEKQGPYDVDVYAIKVPGVIEAEVRVRRVHPLLQEPDDAEAHINLAILDVAYSPTVHGLLGQFYRANATSEPTLNYSILSHLMAMPLVPSESSSEGELEGVPEDYVTSSLLAPDCEFTQFSLFSKKTTSNGDADLSNSGSNNAGTDSSSSSRMTETTSSEIIIRGTTSYAYNRLCGKITKLATLLKKLDPSDAFRIEMTDQLLNKLYNMGVIPTTKSLNLCDKLSVSSFCRRRLAVVMVRLKMAEHMREAVSFVQQGHVRIGPEAVRDPAFLVTRAMEDMLTWVDTSKIKHKFHPILSTPFTGSYANFATWKAAGRPD
ncbi:unnamed protein product [Closterium sp. NIES-64]|nr:unnamed protein product [Closterium sp. NIES-64]